MSRLTELKLLHVKTIPEKLEPGILYVSLMYHTSIHICPCGTCNKKVVLPFRNPTTGWALTEVDGKVTLRPSVGNWQYPCKSHYWITENRIEWL